MTYESDAGYVPDSSGFAIFFLLKAGATSADWVRLSSVEGGIAAPADDTDTLGGRYDCLGFPNGLPALTQAINGAYENIEFSLSGVDATAIRLLGADRDAVDGALFYIGIQDLDSEQQQVGSIDWLMEGTAGKPRWSRQGLGEGALFTITLPVSTALYVRNQSALAFLTPQGQRARSSDDAFCDYVPKIVAGMIVAWP